MDPVPHKCQIANLNEHRLQRLEQAIATTRTKLDVVGIRLEWLGRKLVSTELEKAELRRSLAEHIWELNLMKHRLKRECAKVEEEEKEEEDYSARKLRNSSMAD